MTNLHPFSGAHTISKGIWLDSIGYIRWLTKVANAIVCKCHWHVKNWLAQNFNTRNDLRSVFHQTRAFSEGAGGTRLGQAMKDVL